jgi:hypothetical protein
MSPNDAFVLCSQPQAPTPTGTLDEQAGGVKAPDPQTVHAAEGPEGESVPASAAGSSPSACSRTPNWRGSA